ncbi:MAG: gliding motility-associated C-terminal domain-containing protein [Bacteroidetes bacterium]|nr:gliding motility-associated C-terminal domain-containing protein [Bacteroidota bacterium]
MDRFGSIDNCCVKSSTILVQSAGMVVSPQVQVDKSNVSNTTNTPIGVSVSLQKIISCSPTVSNVSINASFCSGNTYTLPSGAVVSSAGTYVSNLVNAAGCDSIVTVTLSVNNAISTTINSGICPGSSYVLPDGIVVSNPGTYTTILNAANGCDSTIISNLSFQTTVTIAENVVLCSGDKYLLPGGDLIFDAGIYTDTVLTAFGCDSIIITTVAIEPLNGVFAEVPNVFTPNDDGKNDFFVVGNSGYCVESYSILVYNRWGQKVFESTNIDESWDGRISGNIAAAGTYFYIIVSKNNNNSENKKTGFVTVIR